MGGYVTKLFLFATLAAFVALSALVYDVAIDNVGAWLKVVVAYYCVALVLLVLYRVVGNDGEYAWMRQSKALQVGVANFLVVAGYFVTNTVHAIAGDAVLWFTTITAAVMFIGMVACTIYAVDGLAVCYWTREADARYADNIVEWLGSPQYVVGDNIYVTDEADVTYRAELDPQTTKVVNWVRVDE